MLEPSRDASLPLRLPASRSLLPLGPLALVSTLVSLLAAEAPARAETLPIAIHVYCAEGLGQPGGEVTPSSDPCAQANESKLRDLIRVKMAEVNLEFEPTGFSFRPDPILVHYDEPFVEIVNESSPGYDVLVEQAEQATETISLFLLPALERCWSRHTDLGERGVFCTPQSSATVYAHELGHFLCQEHTFWDQVAPYDVPDPATHDPVDHDGDDLEDTPDDPGRFEHWKSDVEENFDGAGQLMKDEDGEGAVMPLRHWCEATAGGTADAGSPHPTYCSVRCFATDPHGDTQTLSLSEAPPTENAMSYYGADCRGPYVVGGVRTEAFTQDQTDRMNFCRAAVEVVRDLPNVCPDGDGDHDGWCDGEDLCPRQAAALNLDLDRDGICDLPAVDTDGDGCPDGADDDPYDPWVRAGNAIAVNCSDRSENLWSYAGLDIDGDGLLACEDPDDDDDKIVDTLDPCPTVGWAGGLRTDDWTQEHFLDCVETVSCPLEEWTDACLFGGCFEVFARFELVSNPDPTHLVTFDTLFVHEDLLYLLPSPGETLSEQMRSIATEAFDRRFGPAPRAGRLPSRGQRVALDLVSKRSGRRVARVVEFDPARVVIGDSLTGRLLRFDPATGESRAPVLSASWGPGYDGPEARDRDGDGVPDRFDNCADLANPLQEDRDLDARGDRCDADLDNDARVGARDLAEIDACRGVAAPADSERLHDADRGDRAERLRLFREALRWQLCEVADLDGDGRVEDSDRRRAEVVQRTAPPDGRATGQDPTRSP